MPAPIVLPAEMSYVAAALFSTVVLQVFQIWMVVRHRKPSGVQYPRLYAEKAEMDANPKAYTFNCVQRAHQNTLEYLPIFYVTTLITALKFPVLAASLLGTWSVSRIGYTMGYATGKRMNALSVLHYPIFTGLLVSSGYTVAQFVL
ncbi:Microsomal glutathione S-transferase 3 [Mycena kentingensis (nom. inval.)]|nr:Microsomal glutathione S-transferase 3 [Mycena kentingensis (nom. inval.)]